MREGLLPPYATILASLVTDEATATLIANQITETFEPEEVAASAFEIPDADDLPASVPRPVRQNAPREGAMGTLLPASDGPWLCEIYFAEAPDEDAIRDFIRDLVDDAAADGFSFEDIAAKDWVAASLEGLQPVAAGRFIVHGSHDRSGVRRHQIGIEIEAALAFGTGHHGTTRGCLLHLDSVLKRRRPHRIVDIGAGTGVLAIAAAKALRQNVLAGEIDPDSVAVARENCAINAAKTFVRPVVSAGLRHATLRARRRYDLVFANILARPLRRLAPEIARATTQAGELILSGLLIRDVPGVLSVYRSQGFHLVRRVHLEGWASLILRRGGDKALKRQDVPAF